LAWAVLADTVPLYPLYVLLFADLGLSEARISALFAIWTAVAVVAEVPSGALADRFGRRRALVSAGLLQAAGYALWTAAPGFGGFAAGFVLWGVGGSLVSGAQEALLHDGLAAAGAQDRYARVQGWVTAAALVAELPAALAATVLFGLGGYPLVGWVSVGVCLAAAGLASRLPEPPRDEDEDEEQSWAATLRAGLAEAAAVPAVRRAVVAAGVLSGLDAVEEYLPLLAGGLGVPTRLVPLATLGIGLVAAGGAALAGRAARLGPRALAALLAAAVLALLAAGALAAPAGLVALAVFYGLYRMVDVVVDARLQERIEGPARATVTSVAGLGTETSALLAIAAWAAGGTPALAVLILAVALALPRLLRGPR